MKNLMTMLALVALGALALTGTSATAGSGDKATGGGQTLVPVGGGAGSTIAFTAQQGTGGATSAKGQVQWIDREAGPKQAPRYHGVVDCLEVDGNFAVIGGFKKTGTSTVGRFILRVVDNGEPNHGADLIQFNEEDTYDDPNQQGDDRLACGDNDPEDEPTSGFNLARGNSKVRDGDANNP